MKYRDATVLHWMSSLYFGVGILTHSTLMSQLWYVKCQFSANMWSMVYFYVRMYIHRARCSYIRRFKLLNKLTTCTYVILLYLIYYVSAINCFTFPHKFCFLFKYKEIWKRRNVTKYRFGKREKEIKNE